MDTTTITGTVHSIETMGAVDGPGLRTVVFLQGCPLRCKFCHNIDCASQTDGKPYTVEELVAVLLKNKAYWGDTSTAQTRPGSHVTGGVTFSGGEPTVQHVFLREVLKALKEHGVHTAIDSCSVTSQTVLQTLIPYIDLWMLSIKHMNQQEHTNLTGTTNTMILDNITSIDRELTLYNSSHGTHKQIRIRFLVIPGLTDAEAHLSKLGSFVQQLNNLEYMELLPYGTHGKHKWEELYGSYPLEGVPDATRADLDRAARLLTPYSLPLLY